MIEFSLGVCRKLGIFQRDRLRLDCRSEAVLLMEDAALDWAIGVTFTKEVEGVARWRYRLDRCKPLQKNAKIAEYVDVDKAPHVSRETFRS